eukprot:363132-Chlamydomonas_euryale.AAC.30
MRTSQHTHLVEIGLGQQLLEERVGVGVWAEVARRLEAVAPVGVVDAALATALDHEKHLVPGRVQRVHCLQVHVGHAVPAPAARIGLVEDVDNELALCDGVGRNRIDERYVLGRKRGERVGRRVLSVAVDDDVEAVVREVLDDIDKAVEGRVLAQIAVAPAAVAGPRDWRGVRQPALHVVGGVGDAVCDLLLRSECGRVSTSSSSSAT